MLEASRARVEALPGDALVLDVGGWAKPLARADWVIDIQPYDTRGLYGEAREGERFTAETWITRDICDREPWPFEDGQFDFVVCSHTLEDIRDPISVCTEMNRVGKAGYLEVPSRLDEQTRGVQGDWVGWSHHRWFCEVDGNHIEFVFKNHYLHGDPALSFAPRFRDTLTPEQRVETLWWDGTFTYAERLMWSEDEAREYLLEFVEAHAPPATAGDRARGTVRRVGRRMLG